MSSPEVEEEEPLDPAVERVRRKLVRLLMVSSGVMVLGFAAVAIAVFYRLSAPGTTADDTPISLPVAASDLRGVAVDDGLMMLSIAGSDPRIEMRRVSDGALVRRFDLDGNAPAVVPD